MLCCCMDSEDPGVRDHLRTELKELELRLMGRIVHMAWLWVIAITLASLALASAFVLGLQKP